MKIRYQIRKMRGNPPYQIFVALYEGDETRRIYTGQRINKKEWDLKKREPKDQQGELYRAIEKVREAVNKAKVKLEANDEAITPFTIQQKYKALLIEKKQAQGTSDQKAQAGLKSVYNLAKAYKENLPDKFSKATQTTVKISVDQFMQYLDKHGLRSLEYKDLTASTVEDYSKYLIERRKLANSTHNKRLKHLNWFLKSISFSFKVQPRKVKRRAIIALTVAELRALEAVEVTTIDLKAYKEATHEFLQRAKDTFLLGCFSALRISDLKRINTTNAADGFISLITKKNNEVFKMPIMPEAQAILARYEGRAPRISEQEVNRSIKIVCQAANINKPIEIEYSKAGKELIKTVPKYSLISSHIAGKTFITNAKELWGLEPAEVAGIVRKDLKTMLNHYFKLPVESAIAKMVAARDRALMKIA